MSEYERLREACNRAHPDRVPVAVGGVVSNHGEVQFTLFLTPFEILVWIARGWLEVPHA